MKKIVEKKISLFKRTSTNHNMFEDEVIDLQNEIKNWNLKASEIQSNFDFIIPNYILDEIIEQQYCHNKDNLYALINCAVINGNITLENAKKIKEIY